MKWGQRTKFDELVLHKARSAQRQLFHQGTRLFERGHVQEEHWACLRLANPPLIDFASQIQSNRSRHFPSGRTRLFAPVLEGLVNCPIARIFVVGTTGKARSGTSFVLTALS